jgi:hypothetical protein
MEEDDWLSGLEDPVSLEPAVPVARSVVSRKRELTFEERKQQELQAIQDSLLEDSLNILSASLKFADMDPEEIEAGLMPAEWVKKYGQAGAEKLVRICRYSLMSKKNAPVGLDVARTVAMGILKATAVEKSARRVLNVQVVQLAVDKAEYPEEEWVENEQRPST